MSRHGVFAEADWATTALKDGEEEVGEYFNDNAVMTLCKLFAGNNNLVDSLVFDYLSRSTRPDKESFRRCFTPSSLEREPWQPRLNSNPKNLDEDWLFLPINISDHWVCVLRLVVFTSRSEQQIKLFYVDSLSDEENKRGDKIEDLLAGTPFYPNESDKVQCEWTRLYAPIQNELECGARACLHGFLLSSIIKTKPIDLVTEGDLMQAMFVHDSVHAMQHARTWARQCLALEKLVPPAEIVMKYLTMTWDEVVLYKTIQASINAPTSDVASKDTGKETIKERRRLMAKLRKRKQRENDRLVQQSRPSNQSRRPTKQSRRSSSPTLVTEGRIDPAHFPIMERIEQFPNQVIESLRVRDKEYSANYAIKNEANLSMKKLEDRTEKRRRSTRISKRKRRDASSIDELEDAKERNRSHQKRFRRNKSRNSSNQAAESTPSVESCLETISNGQAPTMSLNVHPEMRKLQLEFLKRCESKKMQFCRSCKNRWWGEKVDSSGVCRKCRNEVGRKGIALMSKDNNMDPFPAGYPSHLPKLNSIEEAMISRVQVIMKCYRLKDGTVGYKGHVMNFENDTSKIFNQLPLAFKDLPIVILRKRNGKNPNDYRDFQVRRKHVLEWLQFLIHHHPAYKDVKIDREQLNSLPEDGCVADSLLTQFEEDVELDDPTSTSKRDDVPPEPSVIEEMSDDEDIEEGDKMGPEQGGAAGDVGHDDGEEVVHQFLFAAPENRPDGDSASTQGLAPEDARIKTILERVCESKKSMNDNVVLMPDPGDALSDFNTPYIQGMAFPTLFPYGVGDVTAMNRDHIVTMTEANKHLLKYYIEIDGEGMYIFAAHNTWKHWAQNTAERNRLNGQRRVYLKKNPGDENLTEAQLEQLMNEGGPEMQKMFGRMHTYIANIPGSNSYFHKKRRELNALLAQEGMCTFWFTFSAADNHWTDLFRLILGDNESRLYHNKSEDDKAKLRRKLRRENPHIVDAYFQERLDELLDSFFGKKSPLKASWHWYRIEYQGRGSAHAHGCCRLACDPGITQLAGKVLKGRQALQLILARHDPNYDDPDSYLERQDDVWLPEAEVNECRHKYNINVSLETLEKEVKEGNEAHRVIVQFHDWVFSTLHPDPPHDATCEKRDQHPVFVHDENNVHPSAVDPATFLRSTDEAMRKRQYCQQVNVTQRHKCNSYCQRPIDSRKPLDNNNCKCRFGYPQKLSTYTYVVIKEYAVSLKKGMKKVKGKGGRKQGAIKIKYRIELVTRRNDRHLNCHVRVFFECWQANIDFQIILDSGKVCEYMTKYVCKCEPSSIRMLLYMMRKISEKAMLDGQPMSSVLTRVMGKLFGERCMSQQETCHVMSGLALVKCTHMYVNLFLERDNQELNLETLWQCASGEQTIESSLKLSLMDVYGKRLDGTFWKVDKDFLAAKKLGLREMTLVVFASKYDVGKRGPYTNKIVKRKKSNIVIIFYPHVRSDPMASTYPQYCKLSLLKFKPWSVDDQAMLPFNGIEDPTDDDFMTVWEEFLITCEEERKWLPDTLQREIDNHILNCDTSPKVNSDSAMAMDDSDLELQISKEQEESNAFLEIDTDLPHSRNDCEMDPDEVVVRWNDHHDWSILEHQYEKSLEDYIAMYDEFMSNEKQGVQTNSINPTVLRSSLNEQQKIAHDVFVEAVCQETSNEFEPLQILVGQGGCGKTHVLNAINSTLKSKGKVGANFATTGIAAVGIGGSTLHSYSSGFGIPISTGAYKPLTGKTLRRLQELHQNLDYIILDEYTMLKQREVFYLDQRARQVKPKQKDKLFGGLKILFVGDPGQLPAVKGLVLWNQKGSHDHDKRGFVLYLQFKEVTRLIFNERLDKRDSDAREYSEILNRLHDGKNTKTDAALINKKCSRHVMTRAEWRRRGFTNDDTMHLFTTNAASKRHNRIMINNMVSPIALVQAENKGNGQNASSENTQNLENSMYLAVGASVIITSNICRSVVNGSRGIVKEIIYKNEESAPAVPAIVWTEINTFNGNTFFPNDPSRKKWFPIRPKSHIWWTEEKKKRGQVANSIDKKGWIENSRTMLPMKLSWALTVWKAQGQTIRSKIVLHLGDKETEHGLTYTAFSRATRFSDVGVYGGVEIARFTQKIPNHSKMEPRLKEERRYDALIKETKKKFDLYLNNNE